MLKLECGSITFYNEVQETNERNVIKDRRFSQLTLTYCTLKKIPVLAVETPLVTEMNRVETRGAIEKNFDLFL